MDISYNMVFATSFYQIAKPIHQIVYAQNVVQDIILQIMVHVHYILMVVLNILLQTKAVYHVFKDIIYKVEFVIDTYQIVSFITKQQSNAVNVILTITYLMGYAMNYHKIVKQ